MVQCIEKMSIFAVQMVLWAVKRPSEKEIR